MENPNAPATGQSPQSTISLSTEGMRSSYSNFVRGLMTPEEIILDFGMNPNSAGKIVEEPAVLENRIIMSIPSAVRLHQLLHSMLARRQQVQEEAAKQVPPASAS
jgi:hypothetical protein